MANSRYYTVRTKRRKVKTGRLLFLLALCAFLLTIFFSVRFLGELNAIQDQSSWAASLPVPPKGGPEHILLYTVSDSNNGGTITSLAIVAYHPAEKNFRAVNVPQDTLLEAQEHGFMRLAKVYDTGGRELLLSTVSSFFDLPIHTYLEVNEAFLPTALDMVDTESIRATLQITNGGDILSVIHADGVTADQQLERRRTVLSALSADVLNAGTLGKVRAFLRVSPLVRTNMPWRKLLKMMDSFKNTPYTDAARVNVLPGEEQVQSDGRYWLPEVEAIPSLAEWLTDPQAGIPKRQITVEVLNGSGVAGIANKAAKKLQDEGYTVVRTGNADHYDYEISQVISRTENLDAAKDVAAFITGDLLKQEIPGSDVYVTVIIGKNYSEE